jgi:hypothetical protein
MKLDKSKWISVRKSIPIDDKIYLTYSKKINLYRLLGTYRGKFYSDVTHWMELPKEPK